MSGEIQLDGIRWLPYYDVVNLNDLHAFHVCKQSQMVKKNGQAQVLYM